MSLGSRKIPFCAGPGESEGERRQNLDNFARYVYNKKYKEIYHFLRISYRHRLKVLCFACLRSRFFCAKLSAFASKEKGKGVYMGEKMTNAGLLSRLAEETGCNYLSDLRTASLRHELLQRIRLISAEEYSLKEWRDAAAYLIGEVSGRDQAAIRAAIIDALN